MYKERKTSSKVCQDRQDDQAKKIHKDKLKNIKPSIDNSAPKVQTHLANRRKRDQIQEERQATIDKDNMMLLDKMMDIMKKPSSSPSSPNNARRTTMTTTTTMNGTTKRSTSPSKSLNRDHRRREFDRINQDNQMILKKLTTAKSHYSKKDWEEFETKQEKYLKNICEYPVQKHLNKKESTLPMLGTASSKTRSFSSPERASPSSPTATKKTTRRIQNVSPPTNKEKEENDYSDDSLSLSDLDSASDEEFLNGLEKLKASEKSNGKAKKDADSDLDSLGSDFSDSFENDSEKEEKEEKEEEEREQKKSSARSSHSNKSKHSEDEKSDEEKYDNEFEEDDEK